MMTMKRLRKHSGFLLVFALFLPLSAFFLYYQYYDDNDFIFGKRLIKDDGQDLLIPLRRNLWALISSDAVCPQPFIASCFVPNSFHYVKPFSSDRTGPVLRC